MPTPRFTMERGIDNSTYIRQGNARYRMGGTKNDTVARPGGWKLVLDADPTARKREVLVQKSGTIIARLSLDALKEEWLASDAFWARENVTATDTGHTVANTMRYMNQSAGGVSLSLDEALPTDSGWIGVLYWRFLGPSGEPVGAQHLVYIPASNTPAIKRVRLIDATTRFGGDYIRLFHYATKPGGAPKLLLSEPAEKETCQLTEIGAQGERRRAFMLLPSFARPLQVVSDRWLLCSDLSGYLRVDVADLWKKKIRPLQVLPPVKQGYHSISYFSVDETAQTILTRIEGSTLEMPQERALFLVSITTDKKRRLPRAWLDCAIYQWRGYLFVGDKNDSDSYTIYDAGTIKPVQHLAVHPIKLPTTKASP